MSSFHCRKTFSSDLKSSCSLYLCFTAQARHIIKNAFLKNRAAHPSPSSHTEEKLRRLENENLLLREEVESKEAGGERLHGDLESGLKNAQEEVVSCYHSNCFVATFMKVYVEFCV